MQEKWKPTNFQKILIKILKPEENIQKKNSDEHRIKHSENGEGGIEQIIKNQWIK